MFHFLQKVRQFAWFSILLTYLCSLKTLLISLFPKQKANQKQENEGKRSQNHTTYHGYSHHHSHVCNGPTSQQPDDRLDERIDQPHRTARLCPRRLFLRRHRRDYQHIQSETHPVLGKSPCDRPFLIPVHARIFERGARILPRLSFLQRQLGECAPGTVQAQLQHGEPPFAHRS